MGMVKWIRPEKPFGDYVSWENPENILFTKLMKSSLVGRLSVSLGNSVIVFCPDLLLGNTVIQLTYSTGNDRVSNKGGQVVVA